MSKVKKATGNRERTDREKLELFLRKVEELAETNLAKKGFRPILGYTANQTSGLSMELIQPEEDDLRSFLLAFRQFISKEEPVFLDHIYNICSKRLVEDRLKDLVAGSREIWKKTQVVSGTKLTIHGEEISAIEGWRIWINGKYFHNDLEYQQMLTQSTPEALAFLRFNFLSFIGKACNGIHWLDGFIFKALGENKFNFDL